MTNDNLLNESSQFFKDKEMIRAWLKEQKITHYKIIEDEQYGFVVDVQGDVRVNNLGLKFLPVKFRYVAFNFACYENELLSLKGCPDEVGGVFNCSHNKLTNLIGGPSIVGKRYYCEHNELVSLEGAPLKVNEFFNCHTNHLTSLKFCPDVDKSSGRIDAHENNLIDILDMPQNFHHMYSYQNPKLGSAQYCKFKEQYDKSWLEQMTAAEKQKLEGSILESAPTQTNKELSFLSKI